jgi:hypothetical protein
MKKPSVLVYVLKTPQYWDNSLWQRISVITNRKRLEIGKLE